MPSDGERLIAFEAAIQELGKIQVVAARYRSLAPQAAALLGELQDLGRTLRQANRQGLFGGDVIDEAIARIRRLRLEWQRQLAALRESDLYRSSLEAYAADDQARLADLLPQIFAGLGREEAPPPYFQPLVLTSHRRSAGSPFLSAEAVADDIEQLRREGLKPRALGREWWDTDLAALPLSADLAAVDSPAVLVIEAVPAATAVFGDGDGVLIFTPRLEASLSVVLAESSDDAWYEAAEGSYEAYRDRLAGELRRRGIQAKIATAPVPREDP